MPTLPSPPDDLRKDIDSPLGRVARNHDERIAALTHWLDHGYFDGGVAFVRSADGWMMWLEQSVGGAAGTATSSAATARRSKRSGSSSGRKSSGSRASRKSRGSTSTRAGKPTGKPIGGASGRRRKT